MLSSESAFAADKIALGRRELFIGTRQFDSPKVEIGRERGKVRNVVLFKVGSLKYNF
jgi:hypothetical protein